MMMFNQNNNIVVMVSLSDDGEILSKVLEDFGYLIVRGSSNKSGSKALIKFMEYARNGYNLAIAADGPRGPYHKLKVGVIYVAKKTKIPLIPISCSSSKKITLTKTWDNTVIPLPFSKLVQIYGKPIYINNHDNIEEKIDIVEKQLNQLFEFTNKYYWSKDLLKYLEYHPSPKILIIQPGRIGDIIFSLPILSKIKKKYSNASLSWLVDSQYFEILEGNIWLDNIFLWDRKQISYRHYKNLYRQLRNNKFDLSIDLQCLAKSALFVKLAGSKFKIASSAVNGMKEFSWLFSKEIKAPKTYHCINCNLKVAKYLGCEDKIDFANSIMISETSFKSMESKLLQKKINFQKIIGIHAGATWASKRWSIYKFAILAKKLKVELNADVVFIGIKSDNINKEVIKNVGVDMIDKFSLKELCAFLKICKVFIGNESGPIHIATAFNTHAVAILGPTNSNRTGPYKGNTKVLQHHIDCQPCRNKNCKKLTCMENISVAEVFEEVKLKFTNFENRIQGE
jgi:ADP-heptose:LPS heptosyltransferase/lysophospholipid acyltransferase (LPLAT)-like uncharacterized protein